MVDLVACVRATQFSQVSVASIVSDTVWVTIALLSLGIGESLSTRASSFLMMREMAGGSWSELAYDRHITHHVGQIAVPDTLGTSNSHRNPFIN